jgi:hypothetical protein
MTLTEARVEEQERKCILDKTGLKLEENTIAHTHSIGVLVLIIMVHIAACTAYKLCDYLTFM